MADIEAEKAIIARYEANRVFVTDYWAVLREPRPISINAAYSGMGNRFLTKEGATFKDALQAAVSQVVVRHPMPWQQVVDLVYKHGGSIDLTIWLYITDLLNPAWRVGGGMTAGGKKGSKPRPRSPYKTKDASNYIKLIEDAVVKGSGIDDSSHLDVSIKKRQDALDPRILIHYKAYE